MTFPCRIPLCAAAVLAAGSAQGATTFFDGVFAPASWTSSTVTNADGLGSLAVESQLLAGGNPNEYMEIELTLIASAPGGGVFSLNLHNSAFYDPSTQGFITQIDYSEDSINLQPASTGDNQTTGMLIEQGGKVFVQRNPVLVMPNPTFSQWAPNASPGLVAGDLWELTPAGLLVSSSNPDFSVTGGVMQFGFYRGASSGNFVGTDIRLAGIDNWRVRIIPTPGTATLLLIGGLAGLRRRR